MDEKALIRILKNDNFTKDCFKGVFASNELPLNFSYPACFIMNTEERGQDGEHWLAFYFNIKKELYFFDSYGLSPYYYNLINYINQTSTKFNWNMKRIQGKSNYCGVYAFLFLLYITRNKLSKFFSYFSNNLQENDDLILNEIYFNKID